MVTEIIIIIALMVVFAIAGFICLVKDEPLASVFCGVYVLLLGLILCLDMIKQKEEKEEEENTISAVVYDVKDFQIDTNTVVNGTDTTTTYTITYWN